jgi:hypothetical protein
MPSAYHMQSCSVSSLHVVASVCSVQASVALPASTKAEPPSPPLQLQGGQSRPGMHIGQVHEVVVGLPALPLPALETVPDPTQLQLQGGQLSPGAQTGQAQVPSFTQLPSVGSPQLHSHGGQLSPGEQDAQVQVQVPPPAPPSEQSHSMGGHVVPAGQNRGLTQAQPLPSEVLAWQKPPLLQSTPAGHSRSTCDHAQAGLATHSAADSNYNRPLRFTSHAT